MTKPKIQMTNKFQIPHSKSLTEAGYGICYLNIEIYE
jgi:hypothetical protein